jgi:hypothetical protein
MRVLACIHSCDGRLVHVRNGGVYLVERCADLLGAADRIVAGLGLRAIDAV